MARRKRRYRKGTIVKLKNNYGEDFDVRVLRFFWDEDGKGYYVVKPIGFEGFEREVLCEQCYKEGLNGI